MNEKKEEGIGRTKNILFHIYRMFRKGDNIEDSEGGGTKLRYFDVWNTKESRVGGKGCET